MKLPRQKGFALNFLLIAAVILLVIGGGYYLYSKQQSSQTKTFDDFPVWLLRDKKVAVYQEVTISSSGYEKKIVVNNLSDEDQKDVKVYVEIPKEIAQKASDITFSEKVEIIQDDPVVLWDPGEPGQKRTEMSWTDTALFLPRVAGFALIMTRNIAMNNLTDVCKTKTAKDWIEKNTYEKDKNSFLVCGHYLEYLEKEVQKRTADNWQNKSENNKISQTIDATNSQYQQIQQKAKAAIGTPTPTPAMPGKLNAKITNEEAVAIIKAKFGAAKDKECVAAFDNGDNGFRVICNKQNYWVGPAGKYGTFYEFNYHFFFLSKDGKSWTSKGEYSRWKRDEGKDVRTFGAPMWGVK